MCVLPVCMPMQHTHAYRDQKWHQIPWNRKLQTAVGFQVVLGTKPSPLQEQQVILTTEPISPVASLPQSLNKRVNSFRMLVRISLEKLVSLSPPHPRIKQHNKHSWSDFLKLKITFRLAPTECFQMLVGGAMKCTWDLQSPRGQDLVSCKVICPRIYNIPCGLVATPPEKRIPNRERLGGTGRLSLGSSSCLQRSMKSCLLLTPCMEVCPHTSNLHVIAARMWTGEQRSSLEKNHLWPQPKSRKGCQGRHLRKATC